MLITFNRGQGEPPARFYQVYWREAQGGCHWHHRQDLSVSIDRLSPLMAIPYTNSSLAESFPTVRSPVDSLPLTSSVAARTSTFTEAPVIALSTRPSTPWAWTSTKCCS